MRNERGGGVVNGFLGYVHGNSALHAMNPLTKLIMAFALCTSCFLTTSHALVIAIIIFNLGMAAIAGIFKRTLGILFSLLKLSIVLFFVQLFFVREGNIILSLPFNLYVTDLGLSFSSLFVLRLTAATMPLAMMLLVTRMSDIANVLVRSFHIPYKYAFALTTAIRFTPLFSEEMTYVMEAQMARGVEFDTKNFFKKLRLLLPLCVPLLISSVRKVEIGAISAELRGFNLRTRTSGYKKYSYGKYDVTAIIVCIIIIVASIKL
jgi:energy-coupling factor transport system permease protein